MLHRNEACSLKNGIDCKGENRENHTKNMGKSYFKRKMVGSLVAVTQLRFDSADSGEIIETGTLGEQCSGRAPLLELAMNTSELTVGMCLRASNLCSFFIFHTSTYFLCYCALYKAV